MKKLFLLLVGLACGGIARGQVVFDNFPSNVNSINTGSGPIAAPFTFNSGNYALTQITVSLETFRWPITFTTELYLGDGGAGEPLTKLGDFTPSALPNGVQTNVTLSMSSFDILGGQTYWVVFKSNVGGQSDGLELFSSVSGDSFGGIVSTGVINYSSSGVWTPTGRIAAMQIVATAIPEPDTYAAVFGLTALGLAAWRRRRPW